MNIFKEGALFGILLLVALYGFAHFALLEPDEGCKPCKFGSSSSPNCFLAFDNGTVFCNASDPHNGDGTGPQDDDDDTEEPLPDPPVKNEPLWLNFVSAYWSDDSDLDMIQALFDSPANSAEITQELPLFAPPVNSSDMMDHSFCALSLPIDFILGQDDNEVLCLEFDRSEAAQNDSFEVVGCGNYKKLFDIEEMCLEDSPLPDYRFCCTWNVTEDRLYWCGVNEFNETDPAVIGNFTEGDEPLLNEYTNGGGFFTTVWVLNSTWYNENPLNGNATGTVAPISVVLNSANATLDTVFTNVTFIQPAPAPPPSPIPSVGSTLTGGILNNLSNERKANSGGHGFIPENKKVQSFEDGFRRKIKF